METSSEAVTRVPPAPHLPSTERVEVIKLLSAQATELYQKGEALFDAGQTEAGRVEFRRALALLKESGFDFFSHPELEASYFALFERIQSLELRVLADPADLPPPPLPENLFGQQEDAPIDAIADLNLFSIEVDPRLRERVSENLLQARFDIPVLVNDEVLRFLEFYQGRGRKFMEEGLRRSGAYLPLFRRVFEEQGLPLDLIYVPHVESLFKPKAYSRAHAKGLWQFMRPTASMYGLRQDWWIDERSDVLKSTRAAARHLKYLYDLFGDWHLALAAYNAGEGRISRAHSRYGKLDYWTIARRGLIPRETRNYVPSILASLIIFRDPISYGFDVQPDSELQFEVVPVGEQVDLNVVSELIDVPLDALAQLNPELSKGITPFEYEEYCLKVPEGKAGQLAEGLASLPPEKRIRFRYHAVRAGETLSGIAGRYATPIGVIAEVNNIRNINRLRIGQELIIPMMAGRAVPASVTAATSQPLPSSHVVRRGDSLGKIASAYGVTVDDLVRWNNLNRNQVIHPGQKLKIMAQYKSASNQKTSGQ